MTKGWYGNKYGHSLASKGVRTARGGIKMDIPDVDVFGYLENIVLKKDLDDFDWYYSGYSLEKQGEIFEMIEEGEDIDIEPFRSSYLIKDMAIALHDDIVACIQTGENISKEDAETIVFFYLERDLPNYKVGQKVKSRYFGSVSRGE